jgi:peptidoglycan/xylan/chitin deacetylase (PgdA/CDA1 family)
MDSVLALTFDDGPHPEVTPRLLQILRKYQVPATFFVNGDKLVAYPEIARQIISEGHSLGNHSMYHESMIFKSYDYILQDLQRTDSLIQHSGQNDIPFYRPPYGQSFINLPRVLRDHNKRMVNWSIAPEAQYRIPFDGPGIERQVAEAIHPGGIILLHDGIGHNDSYGLALTVEHIILDAQSKGYLFVPLTF